MQRIAKLGSSSSSVRKGSSPTQGNFKINTKSPTRLNHVRDTGSMRRRVSNHLAVSTLNLKPRAMKTTLKKMSNLLLACESTRQKGISGEFDKLFFLIGIMNFLMLFTIYLMGHEPAINLRIRDK